MSDNESTLVDKILKKIKNNKAIAVIIVIGVIIISIASFSESLLKLFNTAGSFIKKKPEVNIIRNNETSITGQENEATASFEDYLKKGFCIAGNLGSDIYNISKDGINIDFSLNNEQSNFQYVLKTYRNALEINPYNEYLNKLKNGGPIRSLSYWDSPFGFQFPTLDFKILNNSGKTIAITKVQFRIAKSRTDPFPILVIHGNGYDMQFPLVNIGWGKVRNCLVNFTLVEPGQSTVYDGNYPYEFNIGDFKKYPEDNDLSPFFKRSGVDVDYIRQIYLYSLHDEIDSNLLKALGPFKEGKAKMFGLIIYEGESAYGILEKDSVKFEATIFLGQPGVGRPIPPSFFYDISFDTLNDSYVRELNVMHEIKSGESDRFDVKISALKSSRHLFDISLIYNDNQEFIIPGIRLNYLMCRGDAGRIKKNDSINVVND